jgi:hypothetical protein
MPGVIRGRTRKIVQLVGEIDRQRGGPPPQSFLKVRLYGTDLGTPLDVGPRELSFLFGDAWTAEGKRGDKDLAPAVYKDNDSEALKLPYNSNHPFNADPVGLAPPDVTAENLDETFELDFRMGSEPEADGGPGYGTLEIPGVSLLTAKVPTGAINTPSGAYVFATGKSFHPGGNPGGDGIQCSWVARWAIPRITLKTEPPYLFSAGRFANYLVPVVGASMTERELRGILQKKSQ